MKNAQFLVLCLGLLIFISCKKESPDPIDPIIPPVEPPPVNVQIFQPGDTSKGAAYANKLTAAWSAQVYCQKSFFDENKLAIALYTFSSQGAERESLGFEFASVNGLDTYQFTKATKDIDNLPSGQIFSSYARWTSDGDVLEDYYKADSTDTNNRLVITKIDLANKRIEGTFHATYLLQEPRTNPANPKKVTFSEGRFWATIRD